MNEAGCRVLLVVRRSGGVVAPVVTTAREESPRLGTSGKHLSFPAALSRGLGNNLEVAFTLGAEIGHGSLAKLCTELVPNSSVVYAVGKVLVQAYTSNWPGKYVNI